MENEKNSSNAKLFIAIGVIILVIGGVSLLSRNASNQPNDQNIEPAVIDVDPQISERQKEIKSEYQGTLLAGAQAPFLTFAQADYEKAKASDKLVVLYFYANWCPTCKKELERETHPAFNELDRDDVVAFRVNYRDSDTEKAEEVLASEFGIGYQHTKVFLKNGEQILKSPESWDKERYLEEIGKAI